MDKIAFAAGLLLILAGIVGLVYGVGINLQGMLARRATDYSSITVYVAEWALMLLAGLFIAIAARRR